MIKAIFSRRIYDGEQFLNDHAVLVEGELVMDVIPLSRVPAGTDIQQYENCTLAPGFIDWQVNGGGGVLFNNDTSAAALEKITQAHHFGGTTSLLPTVISDEKSTRLDAVTAVQNSIDGGNKSIAGIHFEGPFFCTDKKGIHKAQYITSLDDAEVKWLCSLDQFPVLLTLAPEMTSPGQISRLAEHGILVNAGHSGATHETIKQALKDGLRGFTHLFNAMSQAKSREPGVVGSALMDESSWTGIIVDGHHVHYEMVRLAHTAKVAGKLCLVTDAMATVGSKDKTFTLYDEEITEKDGCLINEAGRLAGSAIKMIDAVRLSHQKVGLELAECLRMASLYPAGFLRLDDKLGRIKQGYRADMVLFDDDFCVKQTWVAGRAKI